MSNHHHFFKYLQSKQNRTKIDGVMTIAAVMHPLMGAPQVIKVFSTHQAAGLSMWTWVGWMVFGLVFLVYGIAHKLKPYIYMQLLWQAVDISMIIGILMYG